MAHGYSVLTDASGVDFAMVPVKVSFHFVVHVPFWVNLFGQIAKHLQGLAALNELPHKWWFVGGFENWGGGNSYTSVLGIEEL